jgi:hypothetical protein
MNHRGTETPRRKNGNQNARHFDNHAIPGCLLHSLGLLGVSAPLWFILFSQVALTPNVKVD